MGSVGSWKGLEEPWDDLWKGEMPYTQLGFLCSELTAPSSKAPLGIPLGILELIGAEDSQILHWRVELCLAVPAGPRSKDTDTGLPHVLQTRVPRGAEAPEFAARRPRPSTAVPGS